MKKISAVLIPVLILAFLIYFPGIITAQEIGTITITGSVVNVRSGPGLEHERVGQVKEDSKLPVLERKNGWYKVRLSTGESGWIIDDYAVFNQKVEDNLKILVNDSKINFDTPPYIDNNDRTMVPIRFVAEELGATVGWNGEEQIVNIFFKNKKIILSIGSKIARINEQKTTIDTIPVLKDGRTMVPLRFISEAFGARVSWDGKTRTVGVDLRDSVANDEVQYEKIATLSGNVVNVRNGPGTGFDIVSQLRKGTRLKVIGEGIDDDKRMWYRVKLSDGEGWIASWVAEISIVEKDLSDGKDDVTSPQDLRKEALVIGNVVNIRSGPSLDYKVVTQVENSDRLVVVGKSNEWYEVKLKNGSQGWVHGSLVSIQSSVATSRGSHNRDEYLDKLLDTEEVDFPAIQNLIPIEDEYGVEILIQGNRELDYKDFILRNPWRLVIDIEDTKVALEEDDDFDNADSDIISSIRIGQFEKDISRVVVDLKKPVRYDVKELYDGKVLSVFLQKSLLEGKVIVLDPGHGSLQPEGWADPGAIGPSGTKEADVVMSIAEKTAAILNDQGATVILTRTGDTVLSLTERAQLANDIGADIFASIHANASPNRSTNGTSVYYYAPLGREDLAAQRFARKKLATLIQDNIVTYANTRDIGIIEKGFAVLRETNVPSVLVETAYISNYREEELLTSEEFQNKIAAGIAEGIGEYFMK